MVESSRFFWQFVSSDTLHFSAISRLVSAFGGGRTPNCKLATRCTSPSRKHHRKMPACAATLGNNVAIEKITLLFTSGSTVHYSQQQIYSTGIFTVLPSQSASAVRARVLRTLAYGYSVLRTVCWYYKVKCFQCRFISVVGFAHQSAERSHQGNLTSGCLGVSRYLSSRASDAAESVASLEASHCFRTYTPPPSFPSTPYHTCLYHSTLFCLSQ